MNKKNLLPPGFRDDLSPTTEKEHLYTNKIISIFTSNGYHIVKPPLIEFVNEREKEKNIFVIINENGEQPLKVRNDITMQIARIASSRFDEITRPLRLCYFGEVVRQEGSILRPERQFLQVGAECIGEKNFLADVEILMLAFESLYAAGIKDISVDFSNPIFLNSIFTRDLNKKRKEFFKYLQRKDVSKTLSFVKNSKKINFIKNLILCRGNLSKNIKLLNKLKINRKLSKEIEHLLNVYKLINKKFNKIVFNIDFTENRSHTYYTGLNFTIFAKNVRGEIASGGRYLTRSSNGESATGFTCYMDTILRASSSVLKQKRIMIPFLTSDKLVHNLIRKKFLIERCFNSNNNLLKIAKNKKCTHILVNKKIKSIKNA